MDEEWERIDVLDQLVQIGSCNCFSCSCYTTVQNPKQQQQRERQTLTMPSKVQLDELKRDIEHEKETRRAAVLQIESFLSRASSTTTTTAACIEPLHHHSSSVTFGSSDCFRLFGEVFVVLVESCRYEVEFLRTLYRLSSFFSFCSGGGSGGGGVRIVVKTLLQGLHIWNNISFWIDTVFDLVRYDLLVVERLYLLIESSRNKDASLLFLGLPKCKVMTLIVGSRIQATVASMRSLGLNKENIDSFIQAVNQKFKLEEHHFDISSLSDYSPGSDRSVAVANKFGGTITSGFGTFTPTAVVTLASSNINEIRQQTTSSSAAISLFGACSVLLQRSLQTSNTTQLPSLNAVYDRTITVLFEKDIAQSANFKSKKKFQISNYGFAKILSVFDVGYTILIPLLLLPALDLVADCQDIKSREISPCLCGDIIRPWKLCGIPTPSELRIFTKFQSRNDAYPDYQNVDKIAGVFCECCYRSIFIDPTSLDRMSVSTLGVCPLYGSTMQSKKVVEESLQSQMYNTQYENYEKFLIKVYYDVQIIPSPVKQQQQAQPTKSESPSVRSETSYDSSPPPLCNGAPTTYRNRPLPKTPAHQEGPEHVNALEVEDLRLVDHTSSKTSDLPLSATEFQELMKRLWRGTAVNIVYSTTPFVEKPRLLFIRSDSSTNNELFADRIKKSSASTITILEWMERHCSSGDMMPLYLGWAHRSEANNLLWDANKCVPCRMVDFVKVGNKKYQNCLMIVSKSRTLVIKIEEEEKLKLVIRGLTQLCSMVSQSQN